MEKKITGQLESDYKSRKLKSEKEVTEINAVRSHKDLFKCKMLRVQRTRVILLSGKSGTEPFGHYLQILLHMECFSLSFTDLQKI